MKLRFHDGIRMAALSLALMLLWGGGAAAKTADIAAYPHVKHLVPKGEPEQALGAFALDLELLAATRDDFANMRVIDDTNTEVPFLVRPRGEAAPDGATVGHDIVDFKVHQDGTDTIITFKAYREPAVGIRILSGNDNFSRPVRVEGKSGIGHAGFRDVSRGAYSLISTGDIARDGRTIQLPSATRCTHWRITITNHDNPALEVTGITLIERVHDAILVNTQPSNYRVIYGGDNTLRPRYDMATILRAAGDAPTAAFRLGPEQENEELGGWWPWRIGARVVLLIAILAMVAVLTWGVATAARKVESS